MIRQNQKFFNLLLLLTDAALCFGSMPAAYLLRFGGRPGLHLPLIVYLRMMLLGVPVYLLLYRSFDLYVSFRRKRLIQEGGRIIQANLCGLLFLFVLSYLSKEVHTSRLVLFFFAVINTAASLSVRFLLRRMLRALRRAGRNLKHFLVVGWNENSASFCRLAITNKALGCYIDGYFHDGGPQPFEEAVPWLGTLSDFEGYLADHPIDEVVISLDYAEYPRMQHLLEVCEKEGVPSNLLPFFDKYLPARLYVEDFEGLPLINMCRIPLDNFAASLLKRSFDIAGSLVLLVLLSPLMLAAAIGVRLTSPGPVLYRQERVGRNRRPFTMYKFRSLRADDSGADRTAWSGRTDDRRTPFGRWMRRYSIDELPQLWNVLRGDMSLVGPRPEIPYFVEKFKEEVPFYMLKHLVRPGITGLAQINGWRGDTSIGERIRCDIDYIEHWSFLLDIKILLLTLTRGVVNHSEE
ncbi:MAG: undecaprenyl-phosphate glucose phosphotransferase [Oscillospiraceae bacterium]|nr:MAG: undecaprenyl-phosphate glucose phosphotransferase [Oscillospiraceae bacterium]